MVPSVFRSRPRNIPAGPRRHLSPTEVGSVVGVTPDTVRRWVALGLLPAQRLGPGRRILIDAADLERLMTPSKPPHDIDGELEVGQ